MAQSLAEPSRNVSENDLIGAARILLETLKQSRDEFANLAIVQALSALSGELLQRSNFRDPEVRRSLAVILSELGDAKLRMDDAQGAFAAYQESLSILGNLPNDNMDPEARRRQEMMLNKINNNKYSVFVFYRRPRKDDAITLFRNLAQEGFKVSQIVTSLEETSKYLFPQANDSTFIIPSDRGTAIADKIIDIVHKSFPPPRNDICLSEGASGDSRICVTKGGSAPITKGGNYPPPFSARRSGRCR